MADLRTLCGELGWRDVETYIQSGNVVFTSLRPPVKLESELERAIDERFGLSIPVIVRSGAEWPAIIEGNPFPDASETQANLILLALSKLPPNAGAVEGLRARAANGERIERVGNALWVHYAAGVGTSKLSPALFDRLAGSPVTARNWRTVLKIGKMIAR
jgi:uncharacterized protein (DUF1697 family)